MKPQGFKGISSRRPRARQVQATHAGTEKLLVQSCQLALKYSGCTRQVYGEVSFTKHCPERRGQQRKAYMGGSNFSKFEACP